MARVWHIADPLKPKDAVYIGRPHIYGNPFLVSNMGRDEAVNRYEKYARERIERDPDFREAVKQLAGKDLVCFCAPKRCHGDVLLILAQELTS